MTRAEAGANAQVASLSESTPRYDVMLLRHDGTERKYGSYVDWRRAHEIVAALRRVSCPARVVDTESGKASYDPAAPVRLGANR